MQPSDIPNLVAQIHNAGTQLVIAVNGGSEAISSLLTVPGASKCVLLATVPYSSAAAIEWLGSIPEQYCSAQTARAMAMVAYEKARRLAGDSAMVPKLAGIACTVSLASDRPKRGPHRYFVATQTADTSTCVQVELVKGKRSRAEEEHLAAATVLNETAAACGLAAQLLLDLTDFEQPQRTEKQAPPDWQALWAGKLNCLCVGPVTDPPRALLSGAFNPLHTAHRQMLEIASRILDTPVAYEICIANVDKPPLDYIDADERLRQFDDSQTVWLTRAPTFAEKALLFPGVTFVVGADTLERIAMPRYYYENIAAMLRAVGQIASVGSRFLVFGRKFDGTFQSLDDLNLPPSLRSLCQEVPESEFREDISSTELRRQQVQE